MRVVPTSALLLIGLPLAMPVSPDMLDHIVAKHGLTPEQAYVLSSVAVDLRVGQVVDVPNYVMTAVLNEGVFVEE